MLLSLVASLALTSLSLELAGAAIIGIQSLSQCLHEAALVSSDTW